ncbi:MAG: 3-phosphoshikimate 1-carboxyvinyltransferase, partial [Calditrichaeota bacterium]|nr:3-phosphoshikimate 1-carboxyvinyltransferase [Calditrichota bacterium]
MPRVRGDISLPGDKSISHRAALFAALSANHVKIENYSLGADNMATLKCLMKLGVPVKMRGTTVDITGVNRYFSPKDPTNVRLYAGNSGTTMRLLTGILAGQRLYCMIGGDKSLNKRPMRRIAKPLAEMNADVTMTNAFTAPIHINPAQLKAIDYTLPVASAQVKSCILLAGLFADGETTVTEQIQTRNHTELMLNLRTDNNRITSSIKSPIEINDMLIPGDISSAAFLLVLTLLSKNSKLTIRSVSINPTRTGILTVFDQMGVEYDIENEHESNREPFADITIFGRQKTKGFHLSGDIIPNVIDEIPILAALAALSEGESLFENIEELRFKESDRIDAIQQNLKELGVKSEST